MNWTRRLTYKFYHVRYQLTPWYGFAILPWNESMGVPIIRGRIISLALGRRGFTLQLGFKYTLKEAA